MLATYTGHNASVALVGHGRIVHLEKERFTRRKHDSGGVDDLRSEACRQMDIRESEIAATVRIGPGDEGKVWRGHINQVEQRGENEWMVPHHLAHAAYAFYTSPFQHAGVITMDGGGDGLLRAGVHIGVAMSVGHMAHRFGDTAALRLNLQVPEHESPGHAWCALSSEFFEESGPFGAGKVMALAGVSTGTFQCQTGFPLSVRERIAELQERTTRVFHELADTALATAPRQLVLGGGCALNGIAAHSLLCRADVREIHVPPAVHDGGLTVGAALCILHRTLGVPRCRYAPETVAFAGFTDDVLEGTPPVGPLADALATSKVICLARGRAESGPRALGHRSLLAAPTREQRDRLNAMKGRQCWRPVAPVLTGADLLGPCYFYMTLIASSPRVAELVGAAATHDDRSARVQWAPPDSFLGCLIQAYEARGGAKCLLNTSFNGSGEAIVNAAADASASFARLGADVLVVGEEIIYA